MFCALSGISCPRDRCAVCCILRLLGGRELNQTGRFVGLEQWDAARRKYVLYRNQSEHSDDCVRYPFDAIPRRIFFDTNVINLLVKEREFIFEQQGIGEDRAGFLGLQAEALMHVFSVGSRAGWSLVCSAKSLAEISDTRDDDLRDMLLNYAIEIAETQNERASYAAELGRRVAESTVMKDFPDIADRELLGNAIALECDAFCTCDQRTIVARRNRVRTDPLRILTPAEWWAHVRPWGALWL